MDRIGAGYQGGAVKARNHHGRTAGVADHHGRVDRAEDPPRQSRRVNVAIEEQNTTTAQQTKRRTMEEVMI